MTNLFDEQPPTPSDPIQRGKAQLKPRTLDPRIMLSATILHCDVDADGGQGDLSISDVSDNAVELPDPMFISDVSDEAVELPDSILISDVSDEAVELPEPVFISDVSDEAVELPDPVFVSDVSDEAVELPPTASSLLDTSLADSEAASLIESSLQNNFQVQPVAAWIDLNDELRKDNNQQ